MKKAFTLLEIMISLFISSIIISILYFSHRAIISSITHINVSTKEIMKLSLLQKMFREEILSLFIIEGNKDTFFLLEEKYIGEKESINLCFTTISKYAISIKPVFIRLKEVCYTLQEGSKRDSYELVRKEREVKGLSLDYDRWGEEILVEDIKKFKVLCFDGKDWLKEWDSQKKYIPYGVKIIIATKKNKADIYISLR